MIAIVFLKCHLICQRKNINIKSCVIFFSVYLSPFVFYAFSLNTIDGYDRRIRCGKGVYSFLSLESNKEKESVAVESQLMIPNHDKDERLPFPSSWQY